MFVKLWFRILDEVDCVVKWIINQSRNRFPFFLIFLVLKFSRCSRLLRHVLNPETFNDKSSTSHTTKACT